MAISVSIVILAGGASVRFGTDNKLLADLNGEPLLRHAIRAATQSKANRVVVVTGSDHDSVSHAIGDLTSEVHSFPEGSAGMGDTIAHGVRLTGANADGVMVLPGDMPFVTTGLINRLIDTFAASAATTTVYAATRTGEQRNPVVWPREAFSCLSALSGPAGAKDLIDKLSNPAIGVSVEREMELIDIDTPQDLAQAAAMVAKT